jgi:uncharacterized protein (TIGR01319 family)
VGSAARDSLVILADIGSTFTKLLVVDSRGAVRAASRAPTTVHTDVNLGLQSALADAERQTGTPLRECMALLCSSAAGGLRMAVLGLVPTLTTHAARLAALGAGARIVASYSYTLSDEDAAELKGLHADIVLLAGGTDGGDEEAVVHNARALARVLGPEVVVLMAGNKAAQRQVRRVFSARRAGPQLIVTENILPEIHTINPDPAREAIRTVFLERIVRARGIADLTRTMPQGRLCMPTPLAVMRAAELLADGTASQPGLGDTVVVDIGGATTDVHSVSDPSSVGRLTRGVPEPRSKRTVEGDLGIRINAETVVEVVQEQRLLARLPLALCDQIDLAELARHAANVTEYAQHVSERTAEIALDRILAASAGATALFRHAGRLERVISAQGPVAIQTGKDLSATRVLIGTGGVFGYPQTAEGLLAAIVGCERDPQVLAPAAPELRYDRRYGLFAAGLLRELNPPAAFQLAEDCLNAPLPAAVPA